MDRRWYISEEQWNNQRALEDLANEICRIGVRIIESPPEDSSQLAAVLVDRQYGLGEVRIAMRGKPAAVYTETLTGSHATDEARGIIILLNGAAGEELYMFKKVSVRYLVKREEADSRGDQ
ncbi:hypothetical protein LTR22_025385 [Elasticomyces elasticus]|nr:hypothetical protein LTR22_025385 [Elasticomyces elasticus]KAK4900482.1 hypothetical protein LTR49_027428 [Elasticomyces elasticus]